MSLQSDLKSQMVEAMKAKDAIRLSVIRGLLSAFTNDLIAKGRMPQDELTDDEVLTLISRAVKQRKDSIEQFERGGRPELAEDEKEELAVLQAYLPAQMSRDEISAFVMEKIASENPSKEKAGQFTGSIIKELKGKADGALVKEVVESILS